MNAMSFTYDGIALYDFGYVICDYELTSGLQTSSAGSDLTFTKVRQYNSGSKYYMTSAIYNTCFETSFDIGRCDGEFVSVEDYAELMRWLNRREYKKMSISSPGWENIFFYGTFNVQKIEFHGEIVGLTLTFTTNAPFGFGREQEYNFTISSSGGSYTIRDSSDEVGYVYPSSLVIRATSSGDLHITNSVEDRLTVFHNMSSGETLTMDETISYVQTSDTSHAILDDFNYNFLRIANTYTDRDNVLTFTLPCTVSLTYTPIRKVVF